MPQSGQRFEKGKMRADRRLQKLVPKARTKKELAQRKADEEQLAAYRKEYHDCGHEWLVQNAYRNDTTERGLPLQKLRASSDCCVTLVVSGECVCGTYMSGSLNF